MSDLSEKAPLSPEERDTYEGANPGRYRRLCEPFEDTAEANDMLNKFFKAVSKLREECGIPDVILMVECAVGAEERRADAMLILGDPAHKLPMLARAYGAAREEHERNMGAFIEAGREDYRRRRR